MHKIAKRELQVTCSGKKWTIAIGSHHNLLVFYSRYPLEGALDLGDMTRGNFEELSSFFANGGNAKTICTDHSKWTFTLDEYRRLVINFSQYPFMGELNLGEISKEYCQMLSVMFDKAKKL